MPVRLKEEFIKTQKFAPLFVEGYLKKTSIEKLFKKLLGKIKSMPEFDQNIGRVRFEIFDYGDSSFQEKQDIFLAIIGLVYKTREKLLKHFKIKEMNHFIMKPQKRVRYLTPEAFVMMGNSKLNVKPNKNEYDLLFG